MIKERTPIKMSGLCLAGQSVFYVFAYNIDISTSVRTKKCSIHLITITLNPTWNGQSNNIAHYADTRFWSSAKRLGLRNIHLPPHAIRYRMINYAANQPDTEHPSRSNACLCPRKNNRTRKSNACRANAGIGCSILFDDLPTVIRRSIINQ